MEVIEIPEKPPFDSYQGNEPYLFVSYAHLDKRLVYPIIKDLFKKGVRIWYDEGIPAASNWIEKIADTIIKCDCFLVFITPRALESENVRDEIHLAKSKKKRIFVVYLEETELPSEIELQIGRKHALFKYKITEETFWKKLKDELSKVIFKPILEASTTPTKSLDVEMGDNTIGTIYGLQKEKIAEEEEKRIIPILRQILQDKIHAPIKGLSNEMKVPPEILRNYLEKIAITHKDSDQFWIKPEEFPKSLVSFRNSQVLYYQAEILKIIESYIKSETNKELEFRLVENIQHDTQMGFTIQDDQITGIGLYKCEISTLPEALGFLYSLRVLCLSNNKLRSFPDSFKQLSLLKVLILDNNNFETLPSIVKNLTMLQELCLRYNKLYNLPYSIKNLKNLRRLELDNNNITVIIPESIENLVLLTDLRLSYNKLAHLPESIGCLKSLKLLNLNNNPLVNLPITIGNLKSLTNLYLLGTKIGGIPSHLQTLKEKGQLFVYLEN